MFLIVRRMRCFALVVLVLLAVGDARKGFKSSGQDWGYVTVRKGAHMFWWLYFTKVETYTSRPLVAWLQGGPGGSSTGYGNFAELGPLDLNLKKRKFSWIKDVNVLFVDNPVGTGFSYVEKKSSLTKTNKEIAEDFLELMRGFYDQHPEFESVPFYIVSESYGGKMTAEIALVLDKAIKRGNITSNFLGIGLGDSWIDPVNTVLEWAPYLLAVGAVDQNGYEAITTDAQKTKKFFDQGLYKNSSLHWMETENTISRYAANIDFYNILKPISSAGSSRSSFDTPIAKPQSDDDSKLKKIMSKVQKALDLNTTWGAQTEPVFDALMEDFMKPVTIIVEKVLNTTNLTVAVYNGQLDLIVCTPGTVKWVDNLRWQGRRKWQTAQRQPIEVKGIYEGFEKEIGNLRLYWVNRAGHMVPPDNPAAMDYILRKLTQNYSGSLKRK